MPRRINLLTATLLAALLVAACGQKGPLYLPDEEPPADTARGGDAGDRSAEEDTISAE